MSGLLEDLRDFLTPRQRPQPSQDEDDESPTLVEVTTMTAPQTFSGDAVMVTETPFAGGAIAGGAVFFSRTSADEEQALETIAPTVESNPFVPVQPTPTPTPIVPARNPLNTPNAFEADASSSLSASRATSTPASANEGLSGGAKAGIAFGVLIPVAALLVGALFLIRRKKQQQKEAGMRLDDEKSAMAANNSFPPPSSYSAPPPAAAPASTLSHAPVLPMVNTQYNQSMSRLDGPAPSGPAMAAGMGAGAAVGAAAIAGNRSQTHNEKHANDPANPFGNHAETVAMHNMAPAPAPAPVQQPRAPSPMNIDASDFPLPGSVAPSEKAISLAPASTDNVSIAPGASTMNLAQSAGAPVAAAGAAAGAVVAGAAAGAANRTSPPPPADNVYRVQLDFKPSMEDELEIRAGQLVRMLHGYDDGWALCMRMDRSQQGVVPRTCLSKNTVKPRQGPPPPQGRPNGPPNGQRGPPPPGFQPGRPMTPSGRNSPAPYGAPQGRPMTPQGQRSMTPTGGRNSPAPGQGPRNGPGPAPYAAYVPQRSMSPGPYGAPGGMAPPPSRPDAASRQRSNSLGSAPPQQQGPVQPVKPLSPQSSVARKPVPGMAV